MTATLDEFSDIFSALSDPNRRIVLERLALAGESTATTLAADLPISRQAVVKHLAHLDRARLVQSRRLGREVRYSVQLGQLAATAQGIEAIATGWDRALTELKRFAEETNPPSGSSSQGRSDHPARAVSSSLHPHQPETDPARDSG